jgi:hypothetical protein
MFNPSREPTIRAIFNLDSGAELAKWPIHFISAETASGEFLKVPPAPAFPIGDGYSVVVAYADEDSITLKYTVEDNIVTGYAIQLENVAVNQTLLNAYRQGRNNCPTGGSGNLPALKAGTIFAQTKGNEVTVIVRDSGSWMDPRWREHWWRN